MQSIYFARELQNIIKEIKAQEIIEFLNPIMNMTKNQSIPDSQKSQFSDLIFSSKEGFYSLNQSTDTKRILDSLGFPQIYDSKQLSKLLTAFNTGPDSAYIYSNSVNHALFATFYYALKAMANFSSTLSTLLLDERIKNVSGENSMIEVEILDYDGNGVDMNRLKRVLESITLLHEHLSRLLDDKTSQFKLTYLDSGSDLVIALQSSKQIIDIARLLFEQYWHKIRFKTYDDFDRKIESLSKGLKFVELVHEQVEKSVIDNETGKILTYSILDDMTNITGAGATLKNIDVEEKVDRRKLLAEKKDIKLLGPSSGDAETAA